MKKIILTGDDNFKVVICKKPERIEIELSDEVNVEVIEDAEPSIRISAL